MNMEVTVVKHVCTKCNQEFPEEQLTEFDDSKMCPQCLCAETFRCNNCNERIWLEDNQGSGNLMLCGFCRDNYYNHCADCSALIHSDDARYLSDNDDTEYCSDCFDNRQEEDTLQNIHPYHYKPCPIFHGEGIFYGIELEIDSGGMCDNNASELLSIGNNGDENIYIKQDGSLNSGFEIVTHPMSLEYHQTKMPWQEILKGAIRMYYKSHQAGTCGLHCHISRSALGDDLEIQEKTISNILFFVEKQWDQMLRFSRRTEAQMNRWACRYGYKDSPKELMEHAKNNTIGRYACVNLSNYATIEIRMFRGTLKYQTFIATLQMVDEICRVAISLTGDEMKNLSWQDFVLGIPLDSKSALIDYLKIRQLYVNEPITDECEEI